MPTKEKNELFINRELSWLEFDRRVLALSHDKQVPLAEQLKFAAIYASNLDEFFMVRVGSLYDRSLLKSDQRENKTSMTAAEQLKAIMPAVSHIQEQSDKYVSKLNSKLCDIGYKKVDFNNLSKKEEHFWKKYFMKECFPVLSPQIVDRRHPFPFLRNLETYVGVIIKNCKENAQSKENTHIFGVIPVSSQFERLITVTDDDSNINFALAEELILHFADEVFEKSNISEKCIFRVTRNADIDVTEAMFDHDLDYRDVMSELLKKRRKLAAVRLQISGTENKEIINLLCDKLQLDRSACFEQSSPLDMSYCWKICSKLGKDSANAPLFYQPRKPIQMPTGFSLAKAAQKQDILMCYPYQSIKPFIQMLNDAANDPDVISIKMTLYRVASESKIIEALIQAAENGKEVVTIVELRARFDEQNNIDWSKELEKAGCTVIYGFNDYKVHSKLTLITKKKGNAYSYIAQIGTGNYNEKTAELYTDLTFTTTNSEIGEEVSAVFNNLAVERLTNNVNHLIVAPLCFKSVLLKEIDTEIEKSKLGKPSKIVIKCNSISDKDIIERLSYASDCSVKTDMIIRGICCLKAGVPGVSENIRVRSIVGRYLEHSRIYSFGEGQDNRVYIASGDFLTRNTERRVEVGVRVDNKELKEILNRILSLQLADNVNAKIMMPDGSYQKPETAPGEERVDSQTALYDIFGEYSEKLMQETQTKASNAGKLANRKGFFASLFAKFKKQ